MVIEISRDDGKEPPRTVTFDKSEVFIGRSDKADIVLVNELLSRRAIRIVEEDGMFFLNDGSANGSFINGVHAWGKRAFVEGDEIRVGPFTLRVHRQQKAG
jgi:predicted component of type VI protein secretion system